MRKDPNYLAVEGLIASASTGAFTLPDEVIAAHAVAVRLEAEWRRGGEDHVGPARKALRVALWEAAETGGDFPDAAELARAEGLQSAENARRMMLGDITESAQARAWSAVAAVADEIVTRHLRPALAEVVDSARSATSAFSKHGTTAEALIGAPAEAQDGWLAVDALADRYYKLRDAQTRLARLAGGPQVDTNGIFERLRNMPDVWPQYHRRGTPPWPVKDARGYLVWLVTSGAEPWMPTVAEQDARWAEVFADEIQRQRNARGRAAGGVYVGG